MTYEDVVVVVGGFDYCLWVPSAISAAECWNEAGGGSYYFYDVDENGSPDPGSEVREIMAFADGAVSSTGGTGVGAGMGCAYQELGEPRRLIVTGDGTIYGAMWVNVVVLSDIAEPDTIRWIDLFGDDPAERDRFVGGAMLGQG